MWNANVAVLEIATPHAPEDGPCCHLQCRIFVSDFNPCQHISAALLSNIFTNIVSLSLIGSVSREFFVLSIFTTSTTTHTMSPGLPKPLGFGPVWKRMLQSYAHLLPLSKFSSRNTLTSQLSEARLAALAQAAHGSGSVRLAVKIQRIPRRQACRSPPLAWERCKLLNKRTLMLKMGVINLSSHRAV